MGRHAFGRVKVHNGGGPVNEDEHTLLELNRATFTAEAHQPGDGWVDVLHRNLADDFRLRRAIGEIENRERMIARLSHTEPAPREILDERVTVLEDTAVVRSRVRFGPAVFRNAKLFEKTLDGWRCVYWRVTREPTS
jgi:hypothetical protein